MEEFWQSDAYEWYGSLWFPDEDGEDRFAGRISYSADSGVEVSFHCGSAGLTKNIAKKVAFATAHAGRKVVTLSLFNLFAYQASWSSRGSVYIGSAAGILIGAHCYPDSVASLAIKYDESYENFFVMDLAKERDIIALGKGEPIELQDRCTIDFNTFSRGTGIYGVDDLEAIFRTDTDETMKKLKEAVAPMFESNKLSIDRRLSTELFTVVSSDNANFATLFGHSMTWKTLIEFVVQHSVRIEKTIAGISDSQGAALTRPFPMLLSDHVSERIQRRPFGHFHLPISFSHLRNGHFDLSCMKNISDKWFEIHENPDWAPVVQCIKRLMNINREFGTTPRFSILLSDIPTLFELMGEKPTKPTDFLIERQASEQWNTHLLEHLPPPENFTIGKHLTEIRNAIVHPASYANKENGLYVQLRHDSYKLQLAYTYLGSLFLKEVWQLLGLGDDDLREAYSDHYIDQNAHYVPVKFL